MPLLMALPGVDGNVTALRLRDVLAAIEIARQVKHVPAES
jgi:hypothetical protein